MSEQLLIAKNITDTHEFNAASIERLNNSVKEELSNLRSAMVSEAGATRLLITEKAYQNELALRSVETTRLRDQISSMKADMVRFEGVLHPPTSA